MLYRLIFAATLLAGASGSAFAQQTHTIDVWGARIEVPNRGPGGLFGDGATLPRDAAIATGATKPGVSAIRALAHTAPARLEAGGRRP